MRAWFYRHERTLLMLAYAAAVGALAGLWAAHGWRWGLLYVCTFLLALIVCCLVVEVVDHPDDYL